MLHYFCVFQGNNLGESATLVSQTISQFKQKVHYLPWAESIYQAAFCPWSPYQVRPNRISGLTMTNHSVIVNVNVIYVLTDLFMCVSAFTSYLRGQYFNEFDCY